MAPEFVPGQRWGSLVDHAAIAAAAEEEEDSPEQDELDFQFDEELEESASPPRSSGSENSHVGSPQSEAGAALGQAEQVTFDAEEYVTAFSMSFCCLYALHKKIARHLVSLVPHFSLQPPLPLTCFIFLSSSALLLFMYSLDEREFADLDVDRVVVLVQRAVGQGRRPYRTYRQRPSFILGSSTEKLRHP